MIFVVLAALIIVAGLVFFMYQKELIKPIEIIDPKAQPVKIYVDNCLKQTAVYAMQQVGLSGGFIEVPDSIKKDPRAYLTTYPGKGFKMPYWWYNSIDAVPPEEFIKAQLTDYVQKEIKSCIGNFSTVGGFEINELTQPIVDFELNNKNTIVKLNYEIEVIQKNGDFKTLIKGFEYEIPIRLKKVLELAYLIMERQNKDFFIEQKTIDLMALKKEIPLTDFEATCSPKTWKLSDIKSDLQNLLRINLPYVKIKGTDFNPNVYVPNPKGKSIYSQTYYMSHYVWDLYKEDKAFNNMKVSVNYENWPMDIYARPSSNGILSSNSEKGTQMLSFFCLHIWHFTYDIKYPVVVTITDKDSEENFEYFFNFAFKADIDHNMPNRLITGTSNFEESDEVSNEEFCDETRNEITVFTVDNATTEDINGVNLTFACGRFYCDLGASEWLSLGAAAGVTKQVPYCVNAVIKGVKEGYAEAKAFMQADADGKSQILMMSPVKEIRKLKIVKHLASNPAATNEISENEKVSIMIKGKSIGFESFSVYPQEKEFPLKLAYSDATYDVNVFLTNGEQITGGYSGTWTVSRNALENANGITFHVVDSDSISEDGQSMFISSLSEYSKNIPQPELN